VLVAAVVVAGGRGERFGGWKQFARVGEETVAARSVRAARSVASYVVLVVPDGYEGAGEGADDFVVGGAERSDSVRAGLGQCSKYDVVIIHDAARPLASPELFRRVLEPLAEGALAVIPGIAVTDTVKRVTRDNGRVLVAQTLVRSDLVSVQTPQAFRRDVLERAHADTGVATDDASLVEQLGVEVVVVEGERTNVKVTEASDLETIAESVQ